MDPDLPDEITPDEIPSNDGFDDFPAFTSDEPSDLLSEPPSLADAELDAGEENDATEAWTDWPADAATIDDAPLAAEPFTAPASVELLDHTRYELDDVFPGADSAEFDMDDQESGVLAGLESPDLMPTFDPATVPTPSDGLPWSDPQLLGSDHAESPDHAESHDGATFVGTEMPVGSDTAQASASELHADLVAADQRDTELSTADPAASDDPAITALHRLWLSA